MERIHKSITFPIYEICSVYLSLRPKVNHCIGFVVWGGPNGTSCSRQAAIRELTGALSSGGDRYLCREECPLLSLGHS